jgi:hypothetical protein
LRAKTYLVELVEVPDEDGIVWEAWEQLLAHLPPPSLVLFPRYIPLVAPISRLCVIAAEECVAAKDDVLRVDPVLSLGIGLVAEHIPQAQVVAVGAKRRRGYRSRVSEQVIAPLGA